MSFILQIQEIIEGPIKDLYLEWTGAPLPALPALPPVDVQVAPEEVGDLTSSFGDIAPTSSVGDFAPTSSFGDFSSGNDLGSSFGDLGSSFGDLGSSFGDLSSANELGSSEFGSSFGDIGLNPSVV